MDKRPNSKVNLDRAIQRIYGTGAKYVEIRSMIANTGKKGLTLPYMFYCICLTEEKAK